MISNINEITEHTSSEDIDLFLENVTTEEFIAQIVKMRLKIGKLFALSEKTFNNIEKESNNTSKELRNILLDS